MTNTQAQALLRLQTIDLERLKHQKRLQAIAEQLADSAAIQGAQAKVSAAEEALKPLRTRYRDLELLIQANVEKATNSEARLYSGAVKNPKELQDIQSEVAALKNRHGQLEDDMLELMIELEAAEETLTAAQAELSAVTAEAESQQSDLVAERERLEAQLSKLQSDRQGVLGDVTEQNRRLYDTMKPRKGNRPISTMSGRTCTTCGVEQTMAIEEAVRRGDQMVNCENCGRILVIV
ncbi:MAG: hypothetical protein EA396_04565 [Anaerolineaceae bacterium]|nr:MAG: hypothetical protein EA396_04565 [Anaerolineaceae bacterium]